MELITVEKVINEISATTSSCRSGYIYIGFQRVAHEVPGTSCIHMKVNTISSVGSRHHAVDALILVHGLDLSATNAKLGEGPS